MKKIFLKLGNVRYWIKDNVLLNNNDQLYNLELALDPIEDSGVKIDMDQHSVLIRSQDSFKKRAEIDFKTEWDRDTFEKAYDQYYDKRWDDMPQVEMSLSDYEELLQKWKKIKSEKPQYVIFTLDDSESLDKVDVTGKNELSQEDLQDMKNEHEKYLKYEQARKKYIQNHPDYSDVWRSPADDEYEADIMKYYEGDAAK